MRVLRRWIGAFCAAAVGVFGAGAASAQDFPTRHVTLVVPYAAGGPTDINARILAPALSQALGKQVIVENRPGAGTTIGTASVAQAEADGHTLLFADIGLAVSHNLVAKANYDVERDFAPIVFVTRSSLFLVVNPKLAANDLKELIALAKEKPGQFQFASAGLGSPPHLAGLALTRATGTEMLHVPYKGSGPAVTDVISGQVSLMFLGPSASASHVKAGQLRALAVTGKQRSQALPEVPTFQECGVDLSGIDTGTWWGIVAPAKTPPAVIAKLNRAANQVLADPKLREKFAASDFTVVGGTPEAFGTFVKSQQDYWREALRREKRQGI